MYTLLSATPSPYARKVRIALIEKGIPFGLRTEVPWDGTTETPKYNPLEKLPVLITEGGDGIYESRFILEWLEVKHPLHPLLPHDEDGRLAARQIEVLADGYEEDDQGPYLEKRPNKAKKGQKCGCASFGGYPSNDPKWI